MKASIQDKISLSSNHIYRTRTTRTSALNNILGRWLHFGIAVCMVLCLLLSLIMDSSKTTAITGGTIAFTLHKFIGINGLFLISLYLLWSAKGYAKNPVLLFPWLSLNQLRVIREEVRLGYKHYQNWVGIPAAIQGLGLILALVANISGLLLVFAVIFPHLFLLSTLPTITAFHIFTSHSIWFYLAVHVGAFAIHLVKGNTLYTRMFKLLTLENLPTPAGKLSYKPSQQTTVIAAQNLFKTKETKAAERLKADSKIPLSASDETKMWEF